LPMEAAGRIHVTGRSRLSRAICSRRIFLAIRRRSRLGIFGVLWLVNGWSKV
jgi:hypothetical protein